MRLGVPGQRLPAGAHPKTPLLRDAPCTQHPAAPLPRGPPLHPSWYEAPPGPSEGVGCHQRAAPARGCGTRHGCGGAHGGCPAPLSVPRNQEVLPHRFEAWLRLTVSTQGSCVSLPRSCFQRCCWANGRPEIAAPLGLPCSAPCRCLNPGLTSGQGLHELHAKGAPRGEPRAAEVFGEPQLQPFSRGDQPRAEGWRGKQRWRGAGVPLHLHPPVRHEHVSPPWGLQASCQPVSLGLPSPKGQPAQPGALPEVVCVLHGLRGGAAEPSEPPARDGLRLRAVSPRVQQPSRCQGDAALVPGWLCQCRQTSAQQASH